MTPRAVFSEGLTLADVAGSRCPCFEMIRLAGGDPPPAGWEEQERQLLVDELRLAGYRGSDAEVLRRLHGRGRRSQTLRDQFERIEVVEDQPARIKQKLQSAAAWIVHLRERGMRSAADFRAHLRELGVVSLDVATSEAFDRVLDQITPVLRTERYRPTLTWNRKVLAALWGMGDGESLRRKLARGHVTRHGVRMHPD